MDGIGLNVFENVSWLLVLVRYLIRLSVVCWFGLLVVMF